tara:strand:- start:530 stop:736 length:207 start_codon:yes stop_codon:yes gene_type:complete
MNWFSEKLCQLQNAFSFNNSRTNPVEDNEENDLHTLKVTELKAMAKERGFKGYTSLRKAQLIEMLQQN